MIAKDQPRCCFCNKQVPVTFYCFGCKHYICYDCDEQDKWPPVGHTKPTEHALRNPKQKVRKMTNKQEIARLTDVIKTQESQITSWQNSWTERNKRLNEEYTSHQKALNDLRIKHHNDVQKIADAGFAAIAEAELRGERNAYKQLAELALTKK